jgi:hypothetical protein
MPEYLYSDPKNPKKVVSVVQGMNEKHTYETDGKAWNREYTIPKASIDTQIDPFSQKQFVQKTDGKVGSMGDLWDKSAELRRKREEISGTQDPVRKKYLESYSKKRRGMAHPDSEKPSIEIEYS